MVLVVFCRDFTICFHDFPYFTIIFRILYLTNFCNTFCPILPMYVFFFEPNGEMSLGPGSEPALGMSKTFGGVWGWRGGWSPLPADFLRSDARVMDGKTP